MVRLLSRVCSSSEHAPAARICLVRTRSPRRHHRVDHQRDWQHDCVQRSPRAERACLGNRVRNHLWIPRLLRLRQGRDVGFNDTTAKCTGTVASSRTSADLSVSLAAPSLHRGRGVFPLGAPGSYGGRGPHLTFSLVKDGPSIRPSPQAVAYYGKDRDVAQGRRTKLCADNAIRFLTPAITSLNASRWGP